MVKIKERTKPAKTKLKMKKIKTKQDPMVARDSDDEQSEVAEHEQGIKNLKNIDPEFYSFLKKNDKELLKFNAEDLYNVDDDQEDSDDADEEEIAHKPAGKLEHASDESDGDGDDDDEEEEEEAGSGGDDDNARVGGRKVVTLKLLKQLQAQLNEPKTQLETIRKCVSIFNSALTSISPDIKATSSEYTVKGSAAFNGVLQLSLLYLRPAIWQFLGIAGRKVVADVHKLKKWAKIRNSMRTYIQDLTKLLENISSANILVIMLKHLHQMVPIVLGISGAPKPVLKRLVSLWSTADETVRVLSFLCILKLTRGQQPQFLSLVLKAMYLSYVRNSKFVSPASLPGINFMRRSLTEMFTLDLGVSYQHAFLYIRQLAIHLRNAVTLKKRESYQTVYNWQYVNSLRLWSDVLVATHNKPNLRPLIYPLVTIVHGVIKLIPTAQWFPLRFHCINVLVSLSKQTGIFVPVLPFILEVLHSNTFNRKHTELSMKGMAFTCMLRATKPQLEELSFRNEVVDQIYANLLDYTAHESYTISFPDLIVPAVLELKQYIKRCKVANTNRKLKQLLDLFQDSARTIEQERKNITFALNDDHLLSSWETKMRNKGTPLLTFYTNWVKTNEVKKKRQAANSDDINDYKLPMLKKREPKKRSADDDGEEDSDVDLFPSDDEDSADEAIREKLNGPGTKTQQNGAKKAKLDKQQAAVVPKNKKTKPQMPVAVAEDDDFPENNNVDIIEDLNIDDWE